MVLAWVAWQAVDCSGHFGQAVAQDTVTAERQVPDTLGQKAGRFEQTVAAVFQRHCVDCHGTRKREASLNLSSLEGLVQGGDSGPVVVPGSLKRSLLWTHLQEQTMPPEGRPRLQMSEINTIRRWIDSAVDAASFARPRYSQHEVLPILYLRCVVCHGGRQREADLDLRTRASILKGGKSGPAMVLGDPQQSLILRRILKEEMPPRRRLVEASVKTMSVGEIEILKNWIAAGAPQWQPPVKTVSVPRKAADLWSLKPPLAQPAPQVDQPVRARNPIDTFVMKRLDARGWKLSPEAARPALLRRVALDLTGLPPSLALQDAFLHDQAPGAYERAVDRLLASPDYGERWARIWLDLAGYADSEGVTHQDSVRPHAYRYRDYVIRALNDDKPYDRFLLEQLAGDELADWENAEQIDRALSDNLVATGFLRMAPDGTWANITNFVPDRLDVITAELEILGSAVLGLTVKCARCHAHKFDPISQRDYYRMAAVFRGAFDQHDWLKPYQANQFSSGPFGLRFLSQVPSTERAAWEGRQRDIDHKIAGVEAELQAVRDTQIELIRQKKVAELPEDVRQDVRKMLATAEDLRTPAMKKLAQRFQKQLQVDVAELSKVSPEYRQAEQTAKKKKGGLESRRGTEPQIRALWDRGSPSPTYLLKRGNYLTPGALVDPGVPRAFANSESYHVRPPRGANGPTGRRLAFAQWLIRGDHPLTARVIANRLWKHHFGEGIVSTLDDFGNAGAKPTHPELLDWLAVELVRNRWSLKQLHRLMVTSATYRQTSQVSVQRMEQDPLNVWLSRMAVRRLDAETLRDSLIQLGDVMSRRAFGPPDPVKVRDDGLVVSQPVEGLWRRSVYLQQRRTQIATLLESFDLPSMGPNCVRRPVSTVATQALQMMNNARIHDWAAAFARALTERAGSDPDRQIRLLYRLSVGRHPSLEEFAASSRFRARLLEQWKQAGGDGQPVSADPALSALTSLCHAIFNSAVFLYID